MQRYLGIKGQINTIKDKPLFDFFFGGGGILFSFLFQNTLDCIGHIHFGYKKSVFFENLRSMYKSSRSTFLLSPNYMVCSKKN